MKECEYYLSEVPGNFQSVSFIGRRTFYKEVLSWLSQELGSEVWESGQGEFVKGFIFYKGS